MSDFKRSFEAASPSGSRAGEAVGPAASGINRTGLFARRRFPAGGMIGILALGEGADQGVHTIELNGRHRVVEEPWRFLNHGCEPSAELRWGENEVAVFAKQEISPQEEITIDYRQLPENISERFTCRCKKCLESDEPALIG